MQRCVVLYVHSVTTSLTYLGDGKEKQELLVTDLTEKPAVSNMNILYPNL